MEGFNKSSGERKQIVFYNVAETAAKTRYIAEIEQEGKELLKEGHSTANEIEAALGLLMMKYCTSDVGHKSNGKKSAKNVINVGREPPNPPEIDWSDNVLKQLTEIARRESAAVSLPILIQCRSVLEDYLRRNPKTEK